MHKFKTKSGLNQFRKDDGKLGQVKLPGLYKTRYISIDQSLTSTGIVAADYKLKIKRALTFPTDASQVPEARINQIGSLLDGVLRIEGGFLHMVCIEQPAFNASGQRDILHGVYWECRRRIWLKNPDLEIITAPINSWKKYAVGKGNAKKAFIEKEIQNRYGLHFHSQDCYDAYGILLWAVARYKGEI